MPDISSNYQKWNDEYKWEHNGDEWSKVWGTVNMHWYGSILPRIQAFLPNKRILEIAPGYGRWTNYLKDYCEELLAVDLSDKCIDYCKHRFAEHKWVHCHQNDGKSLSIADSKSVDFVFSYDSLVHVEIDVLDQYLQEISRILSQNGVVFLHHSNRGNYQEFESDPQFHNHWRAKSVTHQLIRKRAKIYGLSCISQELINWSNKPEWTIDCFSIFTVKGSIYDREHLLYQNGQFMIEARQWNPLSKLYDFSYSIKPKTKPLVSIIIPVWNKANLTKQCLEHLIKNTVNVSYEIIAINNASSDNTLEILEAFKKKVNLKIINNTENLGYSIANNQGAQLAEGEYLVLLNNDTIPLSGWLDVLISNMQNDSQMGICGAKLLYTNDSIQHCGVVLRRDRKFFKHVYKHVEKDHKLVNIRKKWDAVTAACFITRKDLYLECGGLDEAYINGCEDIDYCCKIRSKGYSIFYEPKAELYHLESQTPRQNDNDEQNFQRFIDKWGDHALKTEHEIFFEDGFWEIKGKKYVHRYNDYALEWDRLLKDAEEQDNQEEVTRLTKLFRHLYTVAEWDLDTEIPKSLTNNLTEQQAEIFGLNETVRVSDITKQTKVLFICHDFPPYRYAGAQLYAKNLAQAMNQSGLAEVEILHPVFREHDLENKELGSIEESEFEGLKVWKLYKPLQKYDPGIIKNIIVEKAFDEFLKTHRFDIIHFHGLGQLSATPIEVAKKHRIRTVITLHDYWFICEEWHLVYPDQALCSGPESISKCSECFLKYYINPNERERFSHAAEEYKRMRREYLLAQFNQIDVKIAPSRYLKDTFEKYGFKNIIVQPLGFIVQASLEKQKHEKLIFAYAGQIIIRKGINHLVEAFKTIPKDLAELHIYGKYKDNPFTKYLMGQIEQSDNIKYFGAYIPEQLPQIFSSFDISVIPSLMENYPLLVQESFMFKTPVIASKAGGIPEAVIDGRNGLLFETSNIEDLREKIIHVCQNPSLISEFRSNIPKIKTINEDISDYLAYYTLQNPKTLSVKTGNEPLTVQFYIYKNVHWPMFENLYRYIKTNYPDTRIVFCLANINNLTTNSDLAFVKGLFAEQVEFVAHPQEAKADITFIADTIAGKVKSCGKIVNVGHGTISKGYYFTNSIWTERENWVDLLCVPGKYAEKQLADILTTKVKATGMPKMDKVFSGVYTKSLLCEKLGIDKTKAIILYAPTFNIDLSSIFNFAEEFHKIASEDYYVLIKLHGSTVPGLVYHYQKLASESKNMIFINDTDISPYLGAADIMISDVSSAFMEFMALDKPVILYNNPNIKNYHGYNSEDIEYAWRDLGYQVNSFDDCLKKIQDLIYNKSDNLSTKRLHYRELLFSDLQGEACKKVWQESLKLLTEPSKLDLEVLSLFVKVDANEFLIRNCIYFSQFYGVMPIELNLIYNTQTVEINEINKLLIHNEFYKINSYSYHEGDYDIVLDRAIKESESAYCLLIEDRVNLFKNFDYIIHKTFMINPELKAFCGVSNIAENAYSSANFIKQEEGMSIERFSYDCFNRFKCKTLYLNKSRELPELFAFRRDYYLETKSVSIQEFSLNCILKEKFFINPSLFFESIKEEDYQNLCKIWLSRSELNASQKQIYINSLLKIIDQHFYPDFLELIIRVMRDAYSQYKNELYSLAIQSQFQRFYDLDYKDFLLSVFNDIPEFTLRLADEKACILKLMSKDKSINRKISKKKVMLYYFKNVHIPIFKPLLDKLSALNNEIDLALGFMPYAPEIRAGFTTEEMGILKSYNLPMYAIPQDFKADLTLIADSVYPWVQNCGKLVHIGHGILCKGQYYTNTRTAQREEQADLVCVPGEYHAQIMRQIISKPVIATGMSKLDTLFNGTINRKAVCKANNLPEEYKYILFAPTFNDELSAIPFVMNRINEVLPDDKTILLIKLHGSTKKEYQEMYLNLTEIDSRVAFIDDLDISPYLALADLLISDVSSVMIEFAALGKPIVLFNNPHWTEYANYNPSDIEFKYRDIGYQVENLAEMKEAVRQLLAGNDPYIESRKRISDMLIANKYSADATEHIYQEIMRIIN